MDDAIENSEKNRLSCSIIAFRVLLSKKWVDPDNESSILPTAYMPRENGQDDDGLSVEIATFRSYNTLEEGAAKAASEFKKPKGVATLHTGRVRDLNESKNNLDIVANSLPNKPDHGLILGMP